MTNPVYLALDLPRVDAARALAEKVKGHIGGLKLGLEFFCAHGHHGVHELAQVGLPIFLDLKFHDIPNTVAGAMQAIHVLEPAIVTVHASGGRAMMEDAKAAAGENTKVVAVTMLTSLDERDLERTGVSGSAHDQVLRLADLALQVTGFAQHLLSGVVFAIGPEGQRKDTQGGEYEDQASHDLNSFNSGIAMSRRLTSPAGAALGPHLAQHGFEYCHSPHPTAVLRPDGSALVLSMDAAQNRAAFNALAEGMYSNITVTVTDAAGKTQSYSGNWICS